MARRGRLQAAAVLQLGLVVLSNLPLVCDSQTEPEECTGVIREPSDAWPDCATVERFIDLFAVQFDQELDEKCFNSGVAERCPICNKWASKTTPSLYELAYESDFCECDLTAQHCDANCCCDTQCSLDDASVFNGGDGCVDSTPPTLFEH
eukprot:gene3810-14412_t